MLAELRRCGIYDDVAQWHSLDTFPHSLTMFSTCWQYCFPGLPPPAIPIDEYESVGQLPWLGLILEVLVVVRTALQIPIHAMSQSHHTVANRYELHRCRCTAYVLISFLSVSFLKIMDMSHRSSRFFTSTRHLCCAKLCIPLLQTRDIFAHYGHGFRTSITSFTIQVIINNHAFTSDFLHGTHHTTLVQLIRTFYDENTHADFGDVMPSSNLHFTTGSAPTLTGFSVPFRLRSNFPFPRFGSRKASGNTCCVRI